MSDHEIFSLEDRLMEALDRTDKLQAERDRYAAALEKIAARAEGYTLTVDSTPMTHVAFAMTEIAREALHVKTTGDGQ